HEGAPASRRIDLERRCTRELLASVGRHLDVVRNAHGLFGTSAHAFSALYARGVRQGDRLSARPGRVRLDGARRARSGAFITRHTAAEIDDRESKRGLRLEWVRLR